LCAMTILAIPSELATPISYYVLKAQATSQGATAGAPAEVPAVPATAALAPGLVDFDRELRLHVRSSEDFLVRLTKAPDARVVIPELDFELVNRSHLEERGSVGWFLDRAIRNLQEARQGRGFDFSGLGSQQTDAREAGIRAQIEELQRLRALQCDFTVLVHDPYGESLLEQPSEAVRRAHIESLQMEFPEVAYVPIQYLPSLDFEGAASYMLAQRPRTIVLLGAGASTSAGIPDFRSPGTGLYDNLQAYNLPRPTAVFELGFFREQPEPFYKLVRELWPGTHKPTPVHHFVRRLADEGLLVRCYTQNIDGLEVLAGVPEDLVVEAHGHFRSAHGVDSGREVPIEEVRQAVINGDGPEKLRDKYGELVKPDIVFFGEGLPAAFGDSSAVDFPSCELLIVIGTSLKVAPFNELVACVPQGCPRLLLNREAVGLEAKNRADQRDDKLRGGFRFSDSERNTRDVFVQGLCDDGVRSLRRELRWEGD